MDLSRPILLGRLIIWHHSHHGYHTPPKGKVSRCYKAKIRPVRATVWSRSTSLADLMMSGSGDCILAGKNFSKSVSRYQSSKARQQVKSGSAESSTTAGSWLSLYYAVESVGSAVHRKILNGLIGPLVSQGVQMLPKTSGRNHETVLIEKNANVLAKNNTRDDGGVGNHDGHVESSNIKDDNPVESSGKVPQERLNNGNNDGFPRERIVHKELPREESGQKPVSFWVRLPSAAAIAEKGLSAARVLSRRRKFEGASSSARAARREDASEKAIQTELKDHKEALSDSSQLTTSQCESLGGADHRSTDPSNHQHVIKSTSNPSGNMQSAAASFFGKSVSISSNSAYAIFKKFVSLSSSTAAVGQPSSAKDHSRDSYSIPRHDNHNSASVSPTTIEFVETLESCKPKKITPVQDETLNGKHGQKNVSYTYNYNLKYVQVNLFKSPNTLFHLRRKEKISVVPPVIADDSTAYFDSDIPLLEMTDALNNKDGAQIDGGSSSKTAMADRSKKFAEVAGMMKEEKVKQKAAEEKSARKTVGQVISKANIDARTKSLAIGITMATSSASRLLKLERLCNHLVQYPESRHVAIQERLIPTLLKLKRRSKDTTLLAQVHQALAQLGYAPAVKERGIRILSVDGGGSRGIIPIELLRELEAQSGQRIHEMFDYIIGVSSGAVLVYLLAYCKASLDTCEQLFKEFSVKVFNRNSLLGTSKLLMNHAYYDTEAWMKILKSHMQSIGQTPAIELSQDPTCPRVAAVATLMNAGSVKNFLFRNYNPPPNTTSFYQGSSKYQLCESLRASSAAPGYFEEYKLDDYVFQDGGLLTNNPSALGLHESRLLWPDTPIQCLVSLGTGRYDPLEEGLESAEYSSLRKKLYQIMISATDTEAVHTTLQDLLPSGSYFRFNPLITEDFLLDENRPEKIDQLQQEALDFVSFNELRIMQAAGVLTHKKSHLQQAKDWVKDLGDTYHWKP